MTTLSVCFLGTSHLSAVRHAWEQHKAEIGPDLEPTYFGGPGKTFNNFTIEGQALVPVKPSLRNFFMKVSKEADRIEFQRYDAIVLYGIGFGFIDRLHPLFQRFATADLLKWGAERVVSRMCMEDIIRAALEGETCISILRLIRQISAIPVLVHAKPFPPESDLKDPALLRRLRSTESEYLERTISIFQRVGETVCRELDAELFWQPRSTCCAPGFTKAQFSINGRRWGPREAEGEKHMNSEFGWETLQVLLRRLVQLRGVVTESAGQEAVVVVPG